MNDIQIFNNPQFGDIRTSGTSEEPFFCAVDVCRALGYTNGRKAVADHCDEGDVTKRDTPTTSGIQSMTYINESGMYALIFGSKMETAKLFKHWVTSEVLPSIRKHGAYMTTDTIEKVMNDPDSWIKLLQTLKTEREEKAKLEAENRRQMIVLEQQAPKVEYFQKFMTSQHGTTSTGIRELVKQAHISNERKFIEWMEERKILFRGRPKKGKKGRLKPYKEYANCFEYFDTYNENNDWSGKHLKFNPFGKLKIVKMYHDEHPQEFDIIEGLIEFK